MARRGGRLQDLGATATHGPSQVPVLTVAESSGPPTMLVFGRSSAAPGLSSLGNGFGDPAPGAGAGCSQPGCPAGRELAGRDPHSSGFRPARSRPAVAAMREAVPGVLTTVHGCPRSQIRDRGERPKNWHPGAGTARRSCPRPRTSPPRSSPAIASGAGSSRNEFPGRMRPTRTPLDRPWIAVIGRPASPGGSRIGNLPSGIDRSAPARRVEALSSTQRSGPIRRRRPIPAFASDLPTQQGD